MMKFTVINKNTGEVRYICGRNVMEAFKLSELDLTVWMAKYVEFID